MMFKNIINWKFMDLWKVPDDTFEDNRILDSKNVKEIEKKAFDSILMEGSKHARGKAKTFTHKEIYNKMNEIIEKCIDND